MRGLVFGVWGVGGNADIQRDSAAPIFFMVYFGLLFESDTS